MIDKRGVTPAPNTPTDATEEEVLVFSPVSKYRNQLANEKRDDVLLGKYDEKVYLEVRPNNKYYSNGLGNHVARVRLP